MLGTCWTMLAHTGQHLTHIGQTWSVSAKFWRNSIDNGPNSAHVGRSCQHASNMLQTLVNIGQHRPARMWPERRIAPGALWRLSRMPRLSMAVRMQTVVSHSRCNWLASPVVAPQSAQGYPSGNCPTQPLQGRRHCKPGADPPMRRREPAPCWAQTRTSPRADRAHLPMPGRLTLRPTRPMLEDLRPRSDRRRACATALALYTLAAIRARNWARQAPQARLDVFHSGS